MEGYKQPLPRLGGFGILAFPRGTEGACKGTSTENNGPIGHVIHRLLLRSPSIPQLNSGSMTWKLALSPSSDVHECIYSCIMAWRAWKVACARELTRSV